MKTNLLLGLLGVIFVLIRVLGQPTRASRALSLQIRLPYLATNSSATIFPCGPFYKNHTIYIKDTGLQLAESK